MTISGRAKCQLSLVKFVLPPLKYDLPILGLYIDYNSVFFEFVEFKNISKITQKIKKVVTVTKVK